MGSRYRVSIGGIRGKRRGQGRKEGRELVAEGNPRRNRSPSRFYMGPLRGFIAPRERHIGDGEGVGRRGLEGGEAGACCVRSIRCGIRYFAGRLTWGRPYARTPWSYQGEEGSGRPPQLPMAIFRPNRHRRELSRVHSLARYSVTCNRTAINRARVYCRFNGRA